MLTIKGSQKSSTFNKLDQGYNEKDSFNKWCTFENLTGYVFLFFFESRLTFVKRKSMYRE